MLILGSDKLSITKTVLLLAEMTKLLTLVNK